MGKYLCLALGLLFLLGTRPLDAQVNQTTAPIADSEDKGRGDDNLLRQQDERRHLDVRSRLAEAERRNAVLEARHELANQAYSQFEVGMAGLAVMITLLVVGFGLVTHRAAVNAARLELTDVRDKLDALHVEAAAATERALQAAGSADRAAKTAKEAAEKAHSHQRSAQQDSQRVKEAARLAGRLQPLGEEEAEAILSPDEQRTVSEAAKEVEEKRETDWSIDEFKVKIEEARSNGKWEEMLRLARGMEFLHGRDDEAAAYAIYEQGRALAGLNRNTAALDAYQLLIDRFGDAAYIPVQKVVARAMFGKALSLRDLNRSKDAIENYDQLLEKFGATPETYIKTILAMSLYNKGRTLGDDGRFQEALDTHDDLIARFDADENPVLQEAVARAMAARGTTLRRMLRFDDSVRAFDLTIERFAERDDVKLHRWVTYAHWGKALTFARQRKIRSTITALNDWHKGAGEFDCQKIAGSPSFNAIRTRPTFVRFLREKGC